MNKEKRASAVSYNDKEPAPRILAAGRGREAEKIIAIAREAGIEIVEDGVLADLLDGFSGNSGVFKPGAYIPPWCWEAVAKVLAFVISKEKG